MGALSMSRVTQGSRLPRRPGPDAAPGDLEHRLVQHLQVRGFGHERGLTATASVAKQAPPPRAVTGCGVSPAVELVASRKAGSWRVAIVARTDGATMATIRIVVVAPARRGQQHAGADQRGEIMRDVHPLPDR